MDVNKNAYDIEKVNTNLVDEHFGNVDFNKSNKNNSKENNSNSFCIKKKKGIFDKTDCNYGHYTLESEFFLCNCEGVNFYPICKYCYKVCHKDHRAVMHKGKWECHCGKNKHKTKQKNEDEMISCCYEDMASIFTDGIIIQNASCLLRESNKEKKCTETDHNIDVYNLKTVMKEIKQFAKKNPNLNFNLLTNCPEFKKNSFDDLINSIIMNDIYLSNIKTKGSLKDNKSIKIIEIIGNKVKILEICEYLYKEFPNNGSFNLEKLSLLFINDIEKQSDDLKKFIKEINENPIFNKLISNLSIKDKFNNVLNNEKDNEKFRELEKKHQKSTLIDDSQKIFNFFVCLKENFFESYKVHSNLIFFKRLVKNKIYYNKYNSFNQRFLIEGLGKNKREIPKMLIEMLKNDQDKTDQCYSAYYLENKILFVNFIYHMIFKKHVTHNDLNNLGFHSILNMNALQRFTYLNENGKNLYTLEDKIFKKVKNAKIEESKLNKFNSTIINNKELGTESYEELQIDLDSFINYILELFELISKNYANKVADEKISLYLLNKIIKSLIKRNMLTKDQKEKFLNLYYKLIYDFTDIYNNDILKNTDISMKIIFYLLININDTFVINYIKNGISSDSSWCFINNQTQIINSIFLRIIVNYNISKYENQNLKNKLQNKIKNSLGKKDKVQIYIEKIFHLLLGIESFYHNSIFNLNNVIFGFENIINAKEWSLSEIFLNNFDENNNIKINYFYLIGIFSRDLVEINEKFFRYEINFSNYINLFEEKWKLVISSIPRWIPLTKNFHAMLNEPVSIANKSNEITLIRKAVKFTQFYKAIDGFLRINSNNINQAIANSESINFLLYFLFLLIKDDNENLVLLTTLNPENLTKTFLQFDECHRYYYLFLDHISEALFYNSSNDDYRFDNYNFFKGVLLSLKNSIFNQDDDIINGNLEKEKDQRLSKISFLFKYSKKSLRKLTIENVDIIYLIKDVLEFTEDSKYKAFMDAMKTNLNNDIDCFKNTLDAFKNYLKFINQIMTTELPFLDFVKSSHFIFKVDELKKIITTYKIPIDIKVFFIEHYVQREIYPSYRITDYILNSNKKQIYGEEKLDNPNISILTSKKYLLTNTHIEYENSKLNHHSDPKVFLKEFNIIVKFFIDEILKKAHSTFFQEAHQIKFIIKRRIVLFLFFENCILRPSYYIVNQYLEYLKDLTYDESEIIYNITYNVIKNGLIFYDLIGESDITKDREEDKKTFEKLNLFTLENIHVRFFNKNDSSNYHKKIENLNDSINMIPKFKIDKIVQIMREFMNIVFKTEEELLRNYELKESCNDLNICRNEQESDLVIIKRIREDEKSTDNESHSIIQPLIDKHKVSPLDVDLNVLELKKSNSQKILSNQKIINSLLENYKNINNVEKVMTFLINKSENEEFSGYLDNILSYILSNFYINFHNNFNSKCYSYLKILDFLFQDFCDYIQEKLTYPFTIMYNSDKTKYTKKDLFETAYNFMNVGSNTGEDLILDIMFKIVGPSIIYFCNNMNSMKRVSKYNSMSLEYVKIILKFMQNLCENHNFNFQNFFFQLSMAKILNQFSIKDSENLCKALETFNRFYNDNNKKIYWEDLKEKNFEIDKYVKPNKNPDKLDHEVDGKKYLEEISDFLKSKYSFLNFLFINLKMLIRNCKFNSKKDSIQSEKNSFKNINTVIELNKCFTDLIIEMMQTSGGKFNSFFYNIFIPKKISFQKKNDPILKKYYYFLNYIKEMRLFFNEDSSNEINESFQDTINIKIAVFSVFNNLINQHSSEKNKPIIIQILFYFEPNFLMTLIEYYTSILKIKYADESTNLSGAYLSQLKEKDFKKLKDKYQDLSSKNTMYDDSIFQLPASIFLLLIKISEQYKFEEVTQILSKNKIILFSNTYTQEESDKHPGNFYGYYIRKCEFIIKSDDSVKENKSNLKVIYFYTIPKSFMIKKNPEALIKFLNEVDRQNSTTKLQGLINLLETCFLEVNYLVSTSKSIKNTSNIEKDWVDILFYDFKKVDKKNFVFSLCLNLILLLFFENGNKNSYISLSILVLALGQIGLNIYYLLIFYKYKLNYLISIEKQQPVLNEYSILNKGTSASGTASSFTIINFFKSACNSVFTFMKYAFCCEIILLYLNLLIPLLYVLFPQAIIFFPLQLLTVVKFSDTIKEIFMAFQLTFKQILCMIGFLAIIIFLYANLAFYFMVPEFTLTLGDGTVENVCTSLLSCFIIYFNFGIRSGGGIGDIMNPVPYSNFYNYMLIWIVEMAFYITTILLVMNMINGIIITTFGAIRDDYDKKNEDKEMKCFICSIGRLTFEKYKIDFQHHKSYVHSISRYIEYYIYLKNIPEQDLDNDQTYIIERFEKKDISVFPVEDSTELLNADDEKAEE